APPTPPPTGSADTPPAHRAPSRRGAGRGRAGPRVGEEERAPSRPSARPRCGAAGAERDRLAHAAWNEYDACAPSGCLRMRGILLGRSPRILRLQTVFRILTSAHSCRIRDYGSPNRPRRAGGHPMKRKRHTPEQIIRKLRDAEARLASGATIPEVAKELGISETTFHRWRAQYGGMKADEAKRLRELEKENARLKKIVAEQALDISILKEVARGNF